MSCVCDHHFLYKVGQHESDEDWCYVIAFKQNPEAEPEPFHYVRGFNSEENATKAAIGFLDGIDTLFSHKEFFKGIMNVN